MSPRIVFIYAFKSHHSKNLIIVMDTQQQLIKTSIFHIPETNKLLPVTQFLFLLLEALEEFKKIKKTWEF